MTILLNLVTALRGFFTQPLGVGFLRPLFLALEAFCFSSANVWFPGLSPAPELGVPNKSVLLLPGTGGLGTCMVDKRLEQFPVSSSPQKSPPPVVPLLSMSRHTSSTPNDVRSPSDPVVLEHTDMGRCICVFRIVGESGMLNWLARVTTLFSISNEALAVSSATMRRI